jgi:pilus assembly protein Flp/PilA
MKTLKSGLIRLWKEEEGLTVVEYAIAGGLIGAAVIVAFFNLGGTVGAIIAYINTTLVANSPAA